MHPGLIDRPFVPRNIISTQDSPVPLLKFQMAPRFKILMASESKKGTQIYFSLKSPCKRTHSRFPKRAPVKRERERESFTGHFAYLSKPHLSGSPVK